MSELRTRLEPLVERAVRDISWPDAYYPDTPEDAFVVAVLDVLDVLGCEPWHNWKDGKNPLFRVRPPESSWPVQPEPKTSWWWSRKSRRPGPTSVN